MSEPFVTAVVWLVIGFGVGYVRGREDRTKKRQKRQPRRLQAPIPHWTDGALCTPEESRWLERQFRGTGG